MLITSRKEVFYKIEMTAAQAADLQALLETGRNGHVNELSVDKEIADSVNETARNLLSTLEGR